MNTLKRILRRGALAAACVASAAAMAQAYPAKAVTIIVPYPPGGGTDALMRIMQPVLAKMWGQTVVVENKPGAAGTLGGDAVARSAPDGYTLLMSSTGGVNDKNASQFAPIMLVSASPYVIVANPKVPVNNLKELEALAKRQPGKLTFATSGAGPQLVGELFKLTTKTNLLHVPYKGAGPAVLAVLAGETDFMISNPTAVVPHLKAGKLKGIAVLGKARNDAIPDVPHALEAGYPALSDIPEWYGFAVPAGTPAAIVNKLNADFARALNSPDVQAAIRGLGTTPSPSTPDEFARQIAFDYERWGRVVREAGVKAE